MEYRLFKRTYTDRHGHPVQTSNYYIAFKDHLRAHHTWPAFPDEKRSRATADKIGQLLEYRAAGTTPDEKLFQWVEAAPAYLRDRLSKAGIVESGEMARRDSLSVHLKGKLDED